jgi:hypothetical protein
MDLCGSEYGLVKGCCEHGNELSGTMNGVTFFKQLSNYKLFKKDYPTWN